VPVERSTPAAADYEAPSVQERRGFLIKSGVLLAALGMTGLSGTGSALAQGMEAEQVKALQATMDEAMRRKSMKRALAVHGKNLPDNVREVLSTLTASDLSAASRLNTKLARLRKGDTNNNGYIGM